MMKSNLKKIGIGLSCMLVLLSACTDDFLTVPVEDRLTTDNFYQTDEQLLSGTAPLYGQSFFKCQDKLMYSLDMLAGNSIGFATDAAYKQFVISPSNGVLYEGWSGFYRAIADANNMLAVSLRDQPEGISDDVRNRVEAEARFVRAFSYYWLVRLWGPVPVIDVVTSDTSEPAKLNTVESIYAFIEQEFMRAAELLPLVSEDIRRIGKTAPWAYLAEMHLTLKNYEQARMYAKMVMDSGVHSLQTDFQTQFINPDESINRETIYAWQFAVNCAQWGIQNTNQAYLTVASQDITGDTGSFGTVVPSIDLLQTFIRRENATNEVDLRRKWTISEPGEFYPEIRTAKGGYLVPPSGDSPNFSRYRKYVVGSPVEYPGEVCFMRTEMSSHMMRYADVLLIYAEAIMGDADSTQDVEALEAFNRVRDRAGLSPQALITKESMIEERRIEFAMEAGKYWFDLLRIDRSSARDLLRDQERGTLESYDPFVLAGSVTLGSAVDNEFLLPIPAPEIPFLDIQSNPVDYVPSN